MTVMVTGANGLLAVNIIIDLLAAGYRVKGLVRDRGKFPLPPQRHLELITGDITDYAAVENGMDGCDYVIHCAATTSQDLLNYRDYHQVNVVGTENIIQVALKHRLKKIVYVSTANTFGYGSLAALGDETMPSKEPFKNAWYAKSKCEGQQLVLAVADQIAVTIVNPTFMIGPYDAKPSSGKIIVMGYNKKVIFHPPGGKNFVHVADVAKGIVSALEHGKNGATYLLANENLSYREFYQKLAKCTHQKPVLIQLPKVLLMAIGLIGNVLRFFGIKTALSLTNMKILCVHNYYSNQKARKELSLTFQPIENGIESAIEWFKLTKML